MKNGFSTIELLIAMTILTMVLSAVVIVSFGSQSFLIGSETGAEAMHHAQELLEEAQAQARKDFHLVSSTASSTEGIYEKALTVRLLPDFLTKEVTARIAWRNAHASTSTLEITTLISNFDAPIGGNTCESSVVGDWKNPAIENATTDFAALVNDASGIYTLSDVDAYKGRLYVTASAVSGANKPTLFVFDIADTAHPALLGKTDNENGAVTSGLHAVRVAEDPATGNLYAYSASASNSNYSTCNPVTQSQCGQLSIINVTSPASWGAPEKYNFMLASSTAPYVKGPSAKGKSIFYRSGYLLLGLVSTGAGNGPEFHVIDVHKLAALFSISSRIVPAAGSYAVGNDVNSIAMRGTYAYIATPNTQELHTLNMNDPGAISLAGGFNAASGAGNGKSVHLLGNKLYLGKTVPNAGYDLHILENANPGSALSELGGFDVGSSVNAVIQRDYLTFVLTNTHLRIYRTDNPASITSWNTPLALPASGSATEPSMDCEANRMYITANDASGRGHLAVIKPGT
jgi:type II secretory pathway pseudopilin PulG